MAATRWTPAGEFRTPVNLIKVADGPVTGGYNESPPTDALPVARRAKVTPLSGSEFWFARQVTSETLHKLRIRWDSILSGQGLSARWKITISGRTLNIISVVNLEELNREWEIMAKEVTS